MKIKTKILSHLFNEKHGNKLGEFNNTTGTERVKIIYKIKEKLYNHNVDEFHKVPVQRTWWSVIQKNLIRI